MKFSFQMDFPNDKLMFPDSAKMNFRIISAAVILLHQDLFLVALLCPQLIQKCVDFKKEGKPLECPNRLIFEKVYKDR